MKKLMGLGILALLLSFPLQADHGRRRWREHRGDHYRNSYIEIHVGTRHGYGSFVRGFHDAPRFYPRFDGHHHHHHRGKHFKKIKRRYFKRHRHYHYDGYCPY